jgi:hypothetical protein
VGRPADGARSSAGRGRLGEIFNGFEVESNIAYLNELKCTFD